MNRGTKGILNAKNQPVGSEKSNSKAQAEVRSQAGGALEETEGRDEKGCSLREHSGIAAYGFVGYR